MHIPDGVLSPSTAVVAGAAMLPLWAIAGRKARHELGPKQTPLLALGAAFCFTIMLFNIPALGGTTAHPVAGTLLAVLLGPWSALIGISVALAIQALLFGDGGLLVYGANCFTMAFVLPFVGYSLYRLIAGGSAASAPRRALAAGIGAYLGLNAAAAMVGLLLGLQPLLFHEPNGHALYFPFGPRITLPAMLGTHLLIAGPAEAMVTFLVVRYLQRAGQALHGCAAGVLSTRAARREPLWIGLLALVALSPLGLLADGSAWGEWNKGELAQQIKTVQGVAYVPRGLERAEATRYKAVPGLRDYAQPEAGKSNLGYIGAALLGIALILGVTLGLGKALGYRSRGSGREEAQQEEFQKRESRHRDSQGAQRNGERTLSAALPQTPSPDGLRNPVGLPAWLLLPNPGFGIETTKRSNRFLEQTLMELTTHAATALRGEPWARQAGYLQRLDARAKLIGLIGLILLGACLRSPLTLLGLYAVTLLLATASRVPLGPLLRRIWLSVPLFTGAILLPQILNVVTPGPALLTLWLHPYVTITLPGLAAAGLLLLRIGTAVSLGTLLTLTTPWNDLLNGLRALFVPRLFVTILAMTYRYIALLLQTAGEMFTARRSRTVGHSSNAEGRRYVGTGIGALFHKTQALSEEVYAAMLSRGYTGEARPLTRPRWRGGDTAWTLAVLLLAILLAGGENLRTGVTMPDRGSKVDTRVSHKRGGHPMNVKYRLLSSLCPLCPSVSSEVNCFSPGGRHV